MALKIAVVSQKGGVGKSTLARLIAREYANNDWAVKIADMDTKQGTCVKWNIRRQSSEVKPSISVETFENVKAVKRQYENYDLIIFDGKPHSDAQTLEIAKESDLVIIPTGNGLDDLEPSIILANTLISKRVEKDRLYLALPKTGTSDAETLEVMQTIRSARHNFFENNIPEKTAYRRAMDLGLTMTETNFDTLNQKADKLVEEIINTIQKI